VVGNRIESWTIKENHRSMFGISWAHRKSIRWAWAKRK